VQGLANFASQIADGIAVALPALCYLAACCLFLFAAWGLWQQSQLHNPFRGRPWLPWVSLVLCGVFASFDRFLTMANVSAGTNLAVSLTSYSASAPVNASNILGNTPGDTVINVVQLFQGFFQAFGAICIFFALLAWRAVINGQSNRSQGGCFIQFVFGTMCMNMLTIAQWLAGTFQVNS
jgi:hypothetical protein